jgi:hypothetical protein
MALLDLVTRQDFEALAQKLDALLTLAAQPVPTAADDFLTIEQVAAYTHFDRRTVEQWRQEGRYNAQGKKVYLPAYQYSGRLRFKRGDVEAFGLGVGVLTPSAVAGERPTPTKAAPAPPAPAPPGRRKRGGALPSEDALKVA